MNGKTDKFRAACVQMCSGKDPGRNIETACGLVREAVRQGASLVMTPEMTNIIDRPRARVMAAVDEEAGSAAVDAFSRVAADEGVHVLAGSFALRSGEDRLVNRSLLFGPDGSLMARYDKIHMFDVDLDKGESYRESESYTAGDTAAMAALPWGRLGLTICYDVRFGYLYRLLAHAGCSFISVPAAFTRQTGEAHWHVLLRARAIETGCFVFAPAQTGVHEDGRETFGHSLIVAPWGEVLADAGTTSDCVITADIDPHDVTAARRRIPALSHDRAVRGPATSDRQAAE